MLNSSTAQQLKTAQNGHKASDLLIQKQLYSTTRQKILKPADLKEDISLLIYTLENGYIGKDYLPKGEYQKFIKKLEQLYRKINFNSDIVDTANELARIIFSVPDSHLSISFKKDKNSFGLEKLNLKIKHYKKYNGLSIKLGSFSNTKNPEWKKSISKIKKLIKHKKRVVIDLRGNRGGYLMGANQLAAIFYGVKLNLKSMVQSFPQPDM